MTTPDPYSSAPQSAGTQPSPYGSGKAPFDAPSGAAYPGAPSAYPAAPSAYPSGGQVTQGQNGPSGKTRSPIGVFVLSIVTFGIYGLVWYYKVNVELRDFHPSIRVNPVNMILLSIFVPFFFIISVFFTGERVLQAQRLAGLPGATSPAIGLLLAFLIGGHSFYYQDGLNSIWQYRQA